jgi:hypothetical protein
MIGGHQIKKVTSPPRRTGPHHELPAQQGFTSPEST